MSNPPRPGAEALTFSAWKAAHSVEQACSVGSSLAHHKNPNPPTYHFISLPKMSVTAECGFNSKWTTMMWDTTSQRRVHISMRNPASEGSDKDQFIYKEVRKTLMKATSEVPTSKSGLKKKKKKMGSRHGKLLYHDFEQNPVWAEQTGATWWESAVQCPTAVDWGPSGRFVRLPPLRAGSSPLPEETENPGRCLWEEPVQIPTASLNCNKKSKNTFYALLYCSPRWITGLH